MDDGFAEAQHNIRMQMSPRLREQARCADICMEQLEGAVMSSKYASRKECEAARSMAKAIMAAITLDEKAANAKLTGASPEDAGLGNGGSHET